jgi:dolichol-phosphate mannosyltransferase
MLVFLKSKKVRFLICGIIAVAINIAILFIFIEIFKFNTPILKNVANILSTELGILISFFMYRFWVWEIKDSIYQGKLLKQLTVYHLTLGTGILIRTFMLFPFLDWLGVHYILNLTIGILIFTIINYFLNDINFK